MNSRKAFLVLAVAILIGASLNELGRIVAGSPWPHVVLPIHSHIIGAVFSSVWLATAVSLLMRRKSDGWYSASWLLGAASVAVMLFHGAVLRVLGNLVPVVFVPLALLLAVCIKLSFDPEETRAYRERMTRRAERTRQAH